MKREDSTVESKKTFPEVMNQFISTDFFFLKIEPDQAFASNIRGLLAGMYREGLQKF